MVDGNDNKNKNEERWMETMVDEENSGWKRW